MKLPLASDGQGQVTVSGGVPDYNVTWSDQFQDQLA
jgi:hypothetical protein